MITAGADTATVEQATHLAGGGWMRSGYHRTGTGWTAKRHGNRIRWTSPPRPKEPHHDPPGGQMAKTSHNGNGTGK